MNKVKTKNSEGFSGRNQKFERFFRPKAGDLQKKKVFTEIQRDFPAEILQFKQFFQPKTGDLQKKSLHPKIVMQSGVSPQKLQKYCWQTPIWASICTPVALSLIISARHSPRLAGHNFHLGGTSSQLGGLGPGMPPRAPGLVG